MTKFLAQYVYDVDPVKPDGVLFQRVSFSVFQLFKELSARATQFFTPALISMTSCGVASFWAAGLTRM